MKIRILAIADIEAKRYYDHYVPGCLDEFDLILACGDLKREYLEFVVTMAHCPVLYVHGNHDESYEKAPPRGCVCVDDMIVTYQGIRILGLGGSNRYRDGKYMYTERQMARRILRLRWSMWRNHGFDILLTHAPAHGVNDLDTVTHRGFQCFVRLLDKYHPKYFVHGHIHKNYALRVPARSKYGETTVINGSDHYVFDY